MRLENVDISAWAAVHNTFNAMQLNGVACRMGTLCDYVRCHIIHTHTHAHSTEQYHMLAMIDYANGISISNNNKSNTSTSDKNAK